MPCLSCHNENVPWIGGVPCGLTEGIIVKKFWSAAAALSLSVAGVGVVGSPAQAAAPNNYPLSGFFISALPNDQANLDKLKAIKEVGGDTVITFGSQLKPASIDGSGKVVSNGAVNTTYNDCLINGAPCAQAVTAGIKVNRVFTFGNGSHFGGSAIKCARDKNIESKGKLYTLLVIPTIDNGCASSNNAYDLVMVYSGRVTDADPALSVAKAATTLGMKYYAGMPAPIKRTDYGWLPDMSYSATLGKFTERFMMFHASKDNVAGLAGFYHHTEMPVARYGFDSILDVYRMQNAAIKKYLPTRGAVVSPYIDARVTAAGRMTPADTKVAANNIANTASGIKLNIAIQDGMGTSKGGAYMGNEASLNVDKYTAAYMGAGTWGSKYLAPTGDYYRAAKEGVAGTGASLWANIEGMAPSNADTANACNNSLRGQTTKTRLDRQIQQLGETTTKNISFMWDDYYTCVVNGRTLAQDLKARSNEPILSDSSIVPSNGEIKVSGYNLAGAKVTIKYADRNGVVQQKTATNYRVDTAYGRNSGKESRMEAAYFNVGVYNVRPGSYYMINVTNGDGKKNSSFYSKRF